MVLVILLLLTICSSLESMQVLMPGIIVQTHRKPKDRQPLATIKQGNVIAPVNKIEESIDKSKISPSSLQVACQQGDLKKVKELVNKKNPGLYTVDVHGQTPLMIAAQHGHLAIVDYFIKEMRANTLVKDKSGRTVYYYAAAFPAIVARLKEAANVSKDEIERKGKDLLKKVLTKKIKQQMPKAEKQVVEAPKKRKNEPRGAKRPSPLRPSPSDEVNATLFDSFLKKLEHNNLVNIVEKASPDELNSYHYLFKKRNTKLATSDSLKQKFLIYASIQGDQLLPVVQCLVEGYGADPEITIDGEEYTAMHYAAYHGHTALLGYFIKDLGKNRNIKTKKHISLLYAAARGNKKTTIFKFLVDECELPIVEKDRPYEESPLYCAAVVGNRIALEYFLTREPFQKDFKERAGMTLLHLAAHAPTTEALEYLIEHQNFSAHVEDQNKTTPLHQACKAGSLAHVKLLVEKYKVDLNCRDGQGKTPLRWAVDFDKREVVSYLLQRADSLIPDNCGATPLHYIDKEKYSTDIQVIINSNIRVWGEKNKKKTGEKTKSSQGGDCVIS